MAKKLSGQTFLVTGTFKGYSKAEARKDKIEKQFGENLEWIPQPGNRTQYIRFFPRNIKGAEPAQMGKSSDGEIVDTSFRSDPDQAVPDEKNWDRVVEFFAEYAPRFEKTMSDALRTISEQEQRDS